MSEVSETIAILDGGNEKKFLIKKMGAYQAEQWLYKAALAIGRSDADLGSIFGGKPADLVKALLGVDYERAKPILDELLTCCHIVHGEQVKRIDASSAALIESPVTLMKLRVEAFKANFGFFLGGDLLNSLAGSVTRRRAKK